MIWKDKRDVHTLTNTHTPPTKCNFCDKCGKAQKLVTAEDYRWCMGYTKKGDRMASSNSINQRKCKWTKKKLFTS